MTEKLAADSGAERDDDDICGRCGRTRMEHDDSPMACGDFVEMGKFDVE